MIIYVPAIVRRLGPILCLLAFSVSLANAGHYCEALPSDFRPVHTPVDGGIREDVPSPFRVRFERWKTELRSTAFGRQQWDAYAENKGFVLTLKVASAKGKGAGTGKFQWNDEGHLVGATITLGSELDAGFPPPTYYPVLNSLSSAALPEAVTGRILAATKLSHEIAHVDQTAKVEMKLLKTQERLTPIYVSIFLKNGLNTKDQRLVEMAREMGGTPIEIWESREYWSEVDAMHYLRERIGGEVYYCDVLSKIKLNLIAYARDYERRFDSRAGSSEIPCK